MEQSKKDLAKYRLKKAKEHLKSAEYLFQKDCFMDSTSRSYYAIFTAARSMLALKEMDSSKHSGVISLFNQHLVKTGMLSINCSKIMQESKNFREKADYADYAVVDKEVAEKQIENAKRFI